MRRRPLPRTSTSDLLETTARHEAGHAVMRWCVGWPLTRLTAGEGEGLCEGTNRKRNPEDVLLVLLAGPAAEIGYRSGYTLAQLDLAASSGDDFNEGRQLLRDHEWLRYVPADKLPLRVQTIEEALQRYFLAACDRLEQYRDLIEEDLGDRLAQEGTLSSRTVAAICREHEKHQHPEERQT